MRREESIVICFFNKEIPSPVSDAIYSEPGWEWRRENVVGIKVLEKNECLLKLHECIYFYMFIHT